MDLTNQLSPNEIKNLSMGPKNNKTVNQMSHKNVEMWREMFKYLTVKLYRKNELTHIQSIKNIKKKKDIFIKQADKGNSMVALTREQSIEMRDKFLEKDA